MLEALKPWLAANVVPVVFASLAGGGTLGHLLRPVIQPLLDKAFGALPAYLAAKARAEFAAAVKGGKIPPAAVRLLVALKNAALAWANAELAGGTSAQQAALLVDNLAHVPLLTKFVAADRDDIVTEAALEFDALKAEVKKDAPPA